MSLRLSRCQYAIMMPHNLYYGITAGHHYGTRAVWHYGKMAIWQYGSTALWR